MLVSLPQTYLGQVCLQLRPLFFDLVHNKRVKVATSDARPRMVDRRIKYLLKKVVVLLLLLLCVETGKPKVTGA